MLKRVAFVISVLAVTGSSASGVSLLFDYRYDTTGFFTPERRNTLELAGQWIGSRLADSLTAIVPANGNTWTAEFDNPTTGVRLELLNPSIPANTLTIFVGASELGTQTLGEGGAGGYSASGTHEWLDTVDVRGQIGGAEDPPTDFGPWGGTITFDVTTAWYADQDPTSFEAFTGFDFYSVSLHEIAHVLGFGTSLSFNTKIDFKDLVFTGSASTSVYGSQPPLFDEAHWETDTTSLIFGTVLTQEVAMDSSISAGARKHMTDLDMAGLQDVGWIVVPEPSTGGMLGLALGGLLTLRRKTAAGLHIQHQQTRG